MPEPTKPALEVIKDLTEKGLESDPPSLPSLYQEKYIQQLGYGEKPISKQQVRFFWSAFGSPPID